MLEWYVETQGEKSAARLSGVANATKTIRTNEKISWWNISLCREQMSAPVTSPKKVNFVMLNNWQSTPKLGSITIFLPLNSGARIRMRKLVNVGRIRKQSELSLNEYSYVWVRSELTHIAAIFGQLRELRLRKKKLWKLWIVIRVLKIWRLRRLRGVFDEYIQFLLPGW